eukprot:CAMPEP_0175934564 /NCGR_PEP_ID=MMETSP0108-20121206/20563_1 /TAXON_ID=195067 ORGANISM="Goniomonas pacifica, Strain CCMP1869" /NCGR_SAMPLE_ID=MMETSP0108 /ASSEMBLY_ACC=CAM_ASM_000204 /LENGTH=1267 /DNA_ID=CAMNT_0017258423 /DNA_START=342 /DNA_END=4145 /DNA_ORIENTATION=-
MRLANYLRTLGISVEIAMFWVVNDLAAKRRVLEALKAFTSTNDQDDGTEPFYDTVAEVLFWFFVAVFCSFILIALASTLKELRQLFFRWLHARVLLSEAAQGGRGWKGKLCSWLQKIVSVKRWAKLEYQTGENRTAGRLLTQQAFLSEMSIDEPPLPPLAILPHDPTWQPFFSKIGNLHYFFLQSLCGFRQHLKSNGALHISGPLQAYIESCREAITRVCQSQISFENVDKLFAIHLSLLYALGMNHARVVLGCVRGTRSEVQIITTKLDLMTRYMQRLGDPDHPIEEQVNLMLSRDRDWPNEGSKTLEQRLQQRANERRSVLLDPQTIVHKVLQAADEGKGSWPTILSKLEKGLVVSDLNPKPACAVPAATLVYMLVEQLHRHDRNTSLSHRAQCLQSIRESASFVIDIGAGNPAVPEGTPVTDIVVRARNSAGLSDASNKVQTKTTSTAATNATVVETGLTIALPTSMVTATQAPAAISDVTVGAVTRSTVELTWSAPNDASITEYQVEYTVGRGGTPQRDEFSIQLPQRIRSDLTRCPFDSVDSLFEPQFDLTRIEFLHESLQSSAAWRWGHMLSLLLERLPAAAATPETPYSQLKNLNLTAFLTDTQVDEAAPSPSSCPCLRKTHDGHGHEALRMVNACWTVMRLAFAALDHHICCDELGNPPALGWDEASFEFGRELVQHWDQISSKECSLEKLFRFHAHRTPEHERQFALENHGISFAVVCHRALWRGLRTTKQRRLRDVFRKRLIRPELALRCRTATEPPPIDTDRTVTALLNCIIGATSILYLSEAMVLNSDLWNKLRLQTFAGLATQVQNQRSLKLGRHPPPLPVKDSEIPGEPSEEDDLLVFTRTQHNTDWKNVWSLSAVVSDARVLLASNLDRRRGLKAKKQEQKEDLENIVDIPQEDAGNAVQQGSVAAVSAPAQPELDVHPTPAQGVIALHTADTPNQPHVRVLPQQVLNQGVVEMIDASESEFPLAPSGQGVTVPTSNTHAHWGSIVPSPGPAQLSHSCAAGVAAWPAPPPDTLHGFPVVVAADQPFGPSCAIPSSGDVHVQRRLERVTQENHDLQWQVHALRQELAELREQRQVDRRAVARVLPSLDTNGSEEPRLMVNMLSPPSVSETMLSPRSATAHHDGLPDDPSAVRNSRKPWRRKFPVGRKAQQARAAQQVVSSIELLNVLQTRTSNVTAVAGFGFDVEDESTDVSEIASSYETSNHGRSARSHQAPASPTLSVSASQRSGYPWAVLEEETCPQPDDDDSDSSGIHV